MTDLRDIAIKCVRFCNEKASSIINRHRKRQLVDISIDIPVGEDTYHIRLCGIVIGKKYTNGAYSSFSYDSFTVHILAFVDGNFYYGDDLNILFRDEQGDFS